jgi:cell wall-associated NlpC family hydrolase
MSGEIDRLREVAVRVAWACYGKPYIWGGDDAVAGFDCSGFVIEILQSVGILPGGDWKAAGLWDRFADQRVDEPASGRLVFWKTSSGRIRHIEFCIGNGLSIGSSGGGSGTRTEADAIRHNAFIKVRPIDGRGTVAGFVDPFLA